VGLNCLNLSVKFSNALIKCFWNILVSSSVHWSSPVVSLTCAFQKNVGWRLNTECWKQNAL